jgi:hypothetical protein
MVGGWLCSLGWRDKNKTEGSLSEGTRPGHAQMKTARLGAVFIASEFLVCHPARPRSVYYFSLYKRKSKTF